MAKISLKIFIAVILLITLMLCCQKDEEVIMATNLISSKAFTQPASLYTIEIKNNIIIKKYFQFIDSIVNKYDSLLSYTLTEHILVRSNPWIIDTLKNTDYYWMKARDSFIYNQKKMIALPKGASIIIPDSVSAKKLINTFQKTTIDINIPEFKLRIYEDSTERFKFPIRVGRNERKFLKMSGRVQDLKTKTGTGIIVDHVRNPRYVNPANNHQYYVTRRDDEKVTKLPQIPFIVTEINGLRYGQLIHPTTNPITLGKAYSNGCIGTNEADAWVIYYYTPINTKIVIRYDLNIRDENGEKFVLKDIYK